MKVGVAQIRSVPGEVAENCGRLEFFADRARRAGCDVVVFPEMIDSGYDLSALSKIASPWDLRRKELPVSIAARAARDSGLYLICGLSERVAEDVYNTTAVLSPEGTLVGKYRKTHLAAYPFFQEDYFVAPGDELDTVPIGETPWGLAICYDLRFPELFRSLTLGGAEVVALTSAFPFPRLNHWRILTRARAIENQIYLIASNRVGTDAGVTFCGSSCIVDPYGVTVAEAAENREELIIGEIRREIIRSVRDYMPLLDQRREELY